MIEMLVQRGRRGGADDDEEALKVHASFFGGVIIFLCGSNKNTTIRRVFITVFTSWGGEVDKSLFIAAKSLETSKLGYVHYLSSCTYNI